LFLVSRSGGMADAPDSKSGARKGVWVRVPPSVFFISIFLQKNFPLSTINKNCSVTD
jgi:hypothetical protein